LLTRHNNTIKELYRCVIRYEHLATGDEYYFYTDFYTDKGVAKAQATRYKRQGQVYKTDYNRQTGHYDKVYDEIERYLETTTLNWTRI